MSLRNLCFVSMIALLAACQTAPNPDTCVLPSGRFINATVLAACPGKMPADVPHYALDIQLISSDSAMVDNGFEQFPLKITPNGGCSFKLVSATQFGDMELRVTSDSTFELIDSAWTKVTTPSMFRKMGTGDQAEWSFVEFLNDCAVSGSYAMFHHGELIPGEVTLLPNGQIKDWKPFIGYRLCYAGDCLEDTNPPSRTMDLIDDQGKVTTFSVKPVEGKMALELYSIGDPIPDIKGNRPIGPMVYELRTE